MVIWRLASRSALEQQSRLAIVWMRPGVPTIGAASDDNRAILLGSSEQIHIPLVLKEIAPESIGDVGDIHPTLAAITGSVNAGQVFLIFMVAWATPTEVVMCGQQITIAQLDNTGTSQVSPGSRILISQFVELHSTVLSFVCECRGYSA